MGIWLREYRTFENITLSRHRVGFSKIGTNRGWPFGTAVFWGEHKGVTVLCSSVLCMIREAAAEEAEALHRASAPSAVRQSWAGTVRSAWSSASLPLETASPSHCEDTEAEYYMDVYFSAPTELGFGPDTVRSHNTGENMLLPTEHHPSECTPAAWLAQC